MIINTKVKEEVEYQYNNKEEKLEEKQEEKPVEKQEEKQEEKKPVDLEETNFDDELQRLITLELACPSTDSESESD